MAEPPPPLGTFDDSGDDPMDAFRRAVPDGRLHGALQRHRPARDLAAAALDRGRAPGRRPARRAVRPRGPADPRRGAARAGAALGGPAPPVFAGVASTAMTSRWRDLRRAHRDGDAVRRRTARSTSTRPARLAAHLVEHGSHGLVVAGHAPASRRRSPTTRSSSCCEAVQDEVGDDATVISGTGSNDTRHSVEPDARRRRGRRRRRARRDARTTTSPTRPACARTSTRSPRPPARPRSSSTTSPRAP